MADIITGDTQLGPTKQDIIAAAVQRELKFKAKLVQFFLDVTKFAGKGMKSISFPKLTSFTVEERASGVAGNAQTLQSSVDKLELNLSAYISWIVDSNDDIQSTIDFQSEAAIRASAAHGRYVDDKMIAELLNVASLSINAGVPADIDDADVLAMRERLIENEANMDDVILLIPPTQETAMLKIARFSSNEVYGSAVIPTGQIGKVYGIPVIIHNSSELKETTGGGFQQAIMAEREGLAIGFQRSPQFDEQKAIQFGTGAMLQAVDQLFGTKGLQLGVDTDKHVVAADESPLVVKLAD